MKALRATGSLFIVVGATLLLFVLYELVGTSQITDRNQAAIAAVFDDSIDRSSPEQPKGPKPFRFDGPDPIARIRIPKIGVRKYVVEGTTLDDLAWGPGHYKKTAYPGQRGSVGIAGHRTGWGSPFIDLDKLRKGDRIILETPSGRTYTYRVTGTKIVSPADGWVLNGDPDSDAPRRLTLTTCTPKYTSRDRLIVWADQVSGA